MLVQMMTESSFAVPEANSEDPNVGKRLRALASKVGGNKALAARSGIPLSTLTTYLAGRDMKASAAMKIAQAGEVTLDWLMTGIEPGMSQTQLLSSAQNDEIASIPFYDVEASAGFGRTITDAPPPLQVGLSREFLRQLHIQPKNSVIIRVTGDSMEPTIRSGDHIVVNTAPDHSFAGICVLIINGGLMLKRLAALPNNEVSVISDNDRYPSFTQPIDRLRWGEPDGGDTITIIGRVAYRLQALT